MKIRAQIAMVLNLNKCIGCGGIPPSPTLPPRGEEGACTAMHFGMASLGALA